MKFAMLICGDDAEWNALPPDEEQDLMMQVYAWYERWQPTGRIADGGVELQERTTARTVRKNADGDVVVTDGPYVELKEVVGDPKKLDAIIRKVGAALTFDSQGISPAELAFSLRNLREDDLVMVRTPGHGVGEGYNYQGEELDPMGAELLSALGNGQLDTFVVAHPELVSPA